MRCADETVNNILGKVGIIWIKESTLSLPPSLSLSLSLSHSRARALSLSHTHCHTARTCTHTHKKRTHTHTYTHKYTRTHTNTRQAHALTHHHLRICPALHGPYRAAPPGFPLSSPARHRLTRAPDTSARGGSRWRRRGPRRRHGRCRCLCGGGGKVGTCERVGEDEGGCVYGEERMVAGRKRPRFC